MSFLTEVVLDGLDAFKNFQTLIRLTRNLNFSFISIGSDFSKRADSPKCSQACQNMSKEK